MSGLEQQEEFSDRAGVVAYSLAEYMVKGGGQTILLLLSFCKRTMPPISFPFFPGTSEKELELLY